MNRALALLLVSALAATPVFAGPPVAKRPLCQAPKAPQRDAKRLESCRKSQAIPPVIDPTPWFVASTNASSSAPSYLS